uniref:Uncharacterized protein n=1 Tax=Arundo donax TaxID=35708 RepID=A0A0A9HL97_ARUDO
MFFLLILLQHSEHGHTTPYLSALETPWKTRSKKASVLRTHS